MAFFFVCFCLFIGFILPWEQYGARSGQQGPWHYQSGILALGRHVQERVQGEVPFSNIRYEARESVREREGEYMYVMSIHNTVSLSRVAKLLRR